MLSLKKLLSNHFIFLRKVVISSMTIFLLLFGVMPVKVNKVYADENVKINPFIWLMSYFGINIYTDAVQINEAFDTAIRLAYNTYLASLQPQQQVSIDEIIDSIEWTPSQPNVLRITGAVFNALKGFSNWISSKSINDEVVEIGVFESDGSLYYFEPSIEYEIFADTDNNYDWKLKKSNSSINYDVRVVIYGYPDGNPGYMHFDFYVFSNVRGAGINVSNGLNNLNYSTNNQYNDSVYYGIGNTGLNNGASHPYTVDNRVYWFNSFNEYVNYGVNVEKAYDLAFGSSGEATLNDIFALPDQAVLDDLIGAADPDADVEIDLTDSDLPYTTAATLEDILSAINNLVDSYVQDNSYAETIGKVIAKGIAIDDELVDITYPEALTWEVPDLISIPAVYPIIYPDCPDLSACLISGVQEVSNTMNGIINAHPDTGNYVTAALYMGLVLLILGSTVL